MCWSWVQVREGQPSLVDLLAKFPSCHPPLDALLDALPALAPRLYSVASSPLAQPHQVSLPPPRTPLPLASTRNLLSSLRHPNWTLGLPMELPPRCPSALSAFSAGATRSSDPFPGNTGGRGLLGGARGHPPWHQARGGHHLAGRRHLTAARLRCRLLTNNDLLPFNFSHCSRLQ